MPAFHPDNVLEFPNVDHRDADITFGGSGNPACPIGNVHPKDKPRQAELPTAECPTPGPTPVASNV